MQYPELAKRHPSLSHSLHHPLPLLPLLSLSPSFFPSDSKDSREDRLPLYDESDIRPLLDVALGGGDSSLLCVQRMVARSGRLCGCPLKEVNEKTATHVLLPLPQCGEALRLRSKGSLRSPWAPFGHRAAPDPSASTWYISCRYCPSPSALMMAASSSSGRNRPLRQKFRTKFRTRLWPSLHPHQPRQ